MRLFLNCLPFLSLVLVGSFVFREVPALSKDWGLPNHALLAMGISLIAGMALRRLNYQKHWDTIESILEAFCWGMAVGLLFFIRSFEVEEQVMIASAYALFVGVCCWMFFFSGNFIIFLLSLAWKKVWRQNK